MSYLERSGFCTLSEYENGERNIVPVDDLIVDELYLLMIALKAGTIGRQAVKHPVRIEGVELYKTGIYKVEIGLYDDDLIESESAYGLFHDSGYLSNSFGKPNIFRAGYFRDYQDGMDGEWMDFRDSMSVGSLSIEE